MSTKALLMTHMVAFYPDRAASLRVAQGLVDGGCAYLEVQFAFTRSDGGRAGHPGGV